MPTIDVQALSLGAIAADFFAPDFTNPACTVFNTGGSDFWDRGVGHKYLQSNDDTEFIVTTTADFQDVEVETWARLGAVFLRLSDEGNGLRVAWNEGDDSLQLQARYSISDPPGAWAAEGTSSISYDFDMTTFPGYVRDPSTGRYWTFGVSGVDFYVEMSGVEVLRMKQPYQLRAGKVAAKTISGSEYGIDSLIITALAPVSLFSDPDNLIFDPRDYGFKDLLTTGSITASSSTLTVADATGFEIGDPIIVEIGGEAGLGLRGTAGVGGQWPTLTYANAATRDADTTQVNGKWSWVVDTGKTTWWDDGVAQAWSRSTSAPNDYYWSLAVPYALVATITNIVGNVLTLDTSATATATNANVYYNSQPGLNFFFLTTVWPGTNRAISIPAGDYACVGGVAIDGFADSFVWDVYGQGIDSTKLFSPRGAVETYIHIQSAQGSSVHDLEVTGNFRDNGYRFVASSDENISVGAPPWVFTPGVNFTFDGGYTCYNVRSSEHSKQGFLVDFVDSAEINNCHGICTDVQKIYISWWFQASDCTASTPGAISFTDCTFQGECLQGAYETFRSNGIYFIRCTSTNGIWASNSSGNFRFEDCTAILEEGFEPPTYTTAYGESYLVSIASANPIMQVNTNIFPPDASTSQGGVFYNPTIIVEGVANVAGDLPSGLILINADCPNVQIIADPIWPVRACNAPLVGGYMSAPNWSASVDGNGAAIITAAEDGFVYGIRMDGIPNPAFGSISASESSTVINNCVTPGAVTGSGTEMNNITVAQWEVTCLSVGTFPSRNLAEYRFR